MFNKIYIEITNYCNLSCSFCSPVMRPKKEMSIEEFSLIIHKIKDYTKCVYLHVKGEPLLHSHLDEILSICDENNIRVCITTNGTLLKRKKDILIKHHIKQINISLHSENNYPNYFQDIFQTCEILKKQTTIIYRIWTLPTLSLNKLSTPIVDKIIQYYHLDNITQEKIFHEKNIQLAHNLYLDKDYEFTWPTITKHQDNFGTCLGTRKQLAILVNGTVVPCCLDSNGVINLGNIFNDDLIHIIHSPLFQQIKQGFQNYQVVCDLCKSCTYKYRFNLLITKK